MTGRSTGRPAKRGARRKTSSVLGRLTPEEAQEVLKRLLAAHAELRTAAEEHACAVLGAVTFEVIAREVERTVRACDVDELGRRAGRTARGYVEPGQAAWDILEESVEPFVTDLKRRLELGHEDEALEVCKGVVLGLYRLDHGKPNGLLEWATEFGIETAGDVVDAWARAGASRKGAKGPLRALPQAFVDGFVPGWAEMIARSSRGRRGR